MILRCLHEVSGSETVLLSLGANQCGIDPQCDHASEQDRCLLNFIFIEISFSAYINELN